MDSVGSEIQLDVDSGDDMEVIAGNARRLFPLPPPPSEVAIRHSTTNAQTTLICGVPRDTPATQSESYPSWDAPKSLSVAFVPMPLEPSYPQYPPQPKASTGCGAFFHLRARGLNASMSSLPHHKHWIASLRGVASTVIALERKYFGRLEKRWLSGQEIVNRECSVEDVGCAVCCTENSRTFHKATEDSTPLEVITTSREVTPTQNVISSAEVISAPMNELHIPLPGDTLSSALSREHALLPHRRHRWYHRLLDSIWIQCTQLPSVIPANAVLGHHHRQNTCSPPLFLNAIILIGATRHDTSLLGIVANFSYGLFAP
ncbi:hypothetical protein C8R45DRAFT_942953 [Mycena sanguinolenta]|nr:hypothetical protein C8R45DRAFT_942953 [Mycena sanguinolenta]